MDREEILNTLGEVRYELAKVKKKLDNLVSQSIRYKEIHSELDIQPKWADSYDFVSQLISYRKPLSNITVKNDN